MNLFSKFKHFLIPNKKVKSYELLKGEATLKQEKFRVTPIQLGQILYVYALEATKRILEDKKILKDLGFNKVDKNYLFREMMIMHFFTMMVAFQGILDDRGLENDVLNNMNLIYFHELQEKGGLKPEQASQEKNYFFQRYKQYGDAVKGKTGGDLLQILAFCILNNIGVIEQTNAHTMFFLGSHLGIIMENFTKMIIENYEVIKS